MFIATPIGILIAVLLDREMRGTRIYQSIFYLPVVLSLAMVGFIWELQYAPEQGFINNVLGDRTVKALIDWLGDPQPQPVGGAGGGELAARRLHHDPVPGRPEERRSDAARGGARSTAPTRARRSSGSCSR